MGIGCTPHAIGPKGGFFFVGQYVLFASYLTRQGGIRSTGDWPRGSRINCLMEPIEIKNSADAWIKPLMANRPALFEAKIQEIAQPGQKLSSFIYPRIEAEMQCELDLRGRIVYQGYKSALEQCPARPSLGMEEALHLSVKAWLIDQANQIWNATERVRRDCGLSHARLKPEFRWLVVNRTSSSLKSLSAELRKTKPVGAHQLRPSSTASTV
jgi:hypothetical protein